jgi:hypothetical protein
MALTIMCMKSTVFGERSTSVDAGYALDLSTDLSRYDLERWWKKLPDITYYLDQVTTLSLDRTSFSADASGLAAAERHTLLEIIRPGVTFAGFDLAVADISEVNEGDAIVASPRNCWSSSTRTASGTSKKCSSNSLGKPLACANKPRGVVPLSIGAARAVAQKKRASAVAMGVIGNMNEIL